MRGAEKWRGPLSREFDSAINLTPDAYRKRYRIS